MVRAVEIDTIPALREEDISPYPTGTLLQRKVNRVLRALAR
jgi:hypothetical protein